MTQDKGFLILGIVVGIIGLLSLLIGLDVPDDF